MSNTIKISYNPEVAYPDPTVNGESVMFLNEAEDLMEIIKRKGHTECMYASDEPSEEDFTILVQTGQVDRAFVLYWTEFGKAEIELCTDGLVKYFGRYLRIYTSV